MKKILTAFVFSFFLFGCGSSDSEAERNVRLDSLKTVVKRADYSYSSDLDCKVLTATDSLEEGAIFQLKGLGSKSFIGFESDNFEPIFMENVGTGNAILAFVILNNKYGESLLLLDKSTGVFSLSSIEFIETGEKITLKGNCNSF